MNPSLSLPFAAALALAPAAHADNPAHADRPPHSATFSTSPLPSVTDPIGFAGAFAGTHNGHLVAGGGANFPDGKMPWNGGKKIWHNRLFALDLNHPESGWKTAGKLPTPNGYGVSITTPEGILIIGGSDESQHLAEVHLMTLNTDLQATFTPLPPLPEPLAQMCGTSVGRTIHLCGGIGKPTDNTASNKHWTLNLDQPENGWSHAPPLPATGRILATAAAIGNQFIIAGGCSLTPDADGKPQRTYLTDCWGFAGDQWSRLADLPRPSVAAASPAPVSGNSLFLISGDDGKQVGLASPSLHQGFTPEVLRFDLRENRWTSSGNLNVPPPVTLPTAPWKNGSILFNGEVKPGVRTNQVFNFQIHPHPQQP